MVRTRHLPRKCPCQSRRRNLAASAVCRGLCVGGIRASPGRCVYCLGCHLSCGNLDGGGCLRAVLRAGRARWWWAVRGPGDRFAYISRTGSGLVPTVRRTARFPNWWGMRDAGACVECVFDPPTDGVVLAVGAVQVDLMQDAGAVPGPVRRPPRAPRWRSATATGQRAAGRRDGGRARWRPGRGRGRPAGRRARCGHRPIR